MKLPSAVTRFLGYDAISSRGRRRAPATRTKAEDRILPDRDRRRLLATAQDVQRNFAIAAWAVRQHLNYISSFSFQCKTGTEFDDEVEGFIRWWDKRGNCDVRNRDPFRRMIRLAEARRVIDGDFFFMKMAGVGPTRGKLQAIEGDRIATPDKGPDGFKAEHWVNGVKPSPGGAAKEYCINRRTDYGALEFERIVPASSMCVVGYYDRFDQLRGVSPIAAALNTLQDTYEGLDYALAKLKVAQLFGLVFYRDAEAGLATTTATLDADSDGIADSGYEVDFGAGPVQLDLAPGDRAEFLEAKTPAAETVGFLKLMVHVALKALDLPFSFFDEAHTNFYGSRGALLNYLKSCKSKIADLQEMLDELTAWRLAMAIYDGDLVLPRGMTLEDLNWEWVPDGVPWWDPAKEVKGHVTAIAAGLDNPQRICRETGTDFRENIDAIAEAVQYARSKGVELQLAVPGMTTLGEDDKDS